MCIACIEFMKDTLTAKEFRSALREVSREAPEHRKKIEKLIDEHAETPQELKKRLSSED